MNEQASADSIDVDLSAGDAPEKCQKCGTAMNRYNRDLKKPLCVSCSLGPEDAMKMLKAFTQFGEMPETSVEQMESYGIGASAGRILIGALVLGGLTYGSSLAFGSQTKMGGWIGWFVGVVIVGALFFRKANPIDLVRWRRFWRGHLVGFLIAAVAGAVVLLGGEGAHAQAMAPVLEAEVYGLATAAGILTGFLWLSIKNTDDRDEIVVLYREWTKRKAM